MIIRLLRKHNLFFVLIILILTFGILNPSFLKLGNLFNILSQNSIIGVVSLGMTLVIIIGGIDLSVGSIVAFCSIIFGSLAISGVGIMGSSLLTVFAGSFIGFINGYTIEKGNIPAFIVTLGMMSITRGLALLVSGSKAIPLGSVNINQLTTTTFFGVNLPTIIFLGLAFFLWLFLNKTYPGKYLFAIGGNRKAAHFNGINVFKYSIFVYLIAGLFSAIASIILVGSLNSAQPQSGTLYELTAIAAVVIGGASLSGGKGSISGTFLGVLILGVIQNGLSILNVPSYYQYILIGSIIIFSVVFNNRPELKHHEKH